MGRLHYIEASGVISRLEAFSPPSRDKIEAFLGGNQEQVWVRYNGKRACMLVNDEGALRELPINDAATGIYRAWARSKGLPNPHFIHGNAILLEGLEVA